ncbi:hypothetical protein NE670_16195 [Flavonifractor plautii]|uniref:glycine-rich domain-containing protein n=1 Tax=Flavonifractor plautii TaxID=292800 RepID=UPI00210A061E|nr:hypothetical protein [Flavonifractor plautii]MCQ4786796.1 hypothetical protein [Flavonifractor plautii]
MAITPFEKDIEIIQKLDDEPNDVQGLTPEELKKRFDQAAIWLKEYINGTLIPAITGDGGTGGASNIGAAVDDFPGETVQEVLDAFNDALTDRYTKSETNSYVGQETENLVETVHVDLTTGVITVTKKDGSKETFDTALEKVPATMALVDEESGTYLVITNVDGSQTKTDVSKLIDTYTFQNSAEVAFSVDGSGNNKTVTASIRPASIGLDRFTLEVTQKLEQYNATSKANADAAAASAQAAKASETNAKGSETAASGSASQSAQSAGAASGSASQAAQSAGAAAASAESAQSNAAQALAAKNAAEASATLSQSWTEGGTGIREGENTNNAKYWAGVAQGAAGGGVTTFNGRSGAVVPAKGDYTAKMVGAVAEPNGGKAGQVLTKTEDGTEWGDAPNAENAVTVPGGGTMQMGESLGDGPYTIEVTEDGEGGGIPAEQVGYSNTGSGLKATNVQEAIDELAGKGGGEYLPLTGGTMTGPLTLSGLPTSENHAANKQYVDTSVEQALGSIGYSLIKEYTSPGSYTHTFDRKYTDVFVVVVGAGGGGGSSGERGGGGGGGGAAAFFHVLDSSTIQNNSIVVGTGGAGAVSSLGPSVTNNGSAGGSSSAFGITVPGGSGGIANLGGMGGGYAPNEIVPGWLMIGGSGGSHNNNGDGDGNAGPIISIVGFKPFGGGGGGGGNPSLNDPPTPGGNGGDGGAGNGGAGATGQSNAIMGKNGTRGGGGGGGGAGWTFRSSEYKPSGIGGKGGDGYVAIYGRE